MKQILVAVADYPDSYGGVSLMYVHVRNKYYVKQGLAVTVLNFSAKKDYIMDGIEVITSMSYKMRKKDFDILICHAANIRNHYIFLRQNQKFFREIIFFFHGHEVLYINKEYPKPYKYVHVESRMKRFIQNIYDFFKLSIWRNYYLNSTNVHLIFVSNWIKNKFMEYTKIRLELFRNVYVIHNSVGAVFEEKTYDRNKKKEYDFITIRSDLDGSKYGVDLVNNLAMHNPEMKFLIIGQGRFFEYNKKSPNVKWVDRVMQHEEMIEYINRSRCALLLTREDTQGVMTCEMLTFGIPVITSEIAVCREFFADKRNCRLISNDYNGSLSRILEELEKNYSENKTHDFDADRTILKEVEILRKF